MPLEQNSQCKQMKSPLLFTPSEASSLGAVAIVPDRFLVRH